MAKLDKANYKVKSVSREDCEEYLLKIHYAHRWPTMSHAFGLFYKSECGEYELCGVVTYGTPSSQPLREHIAGLEFEFNIIELTRLCLKHNRKNEASFLVGRSLKLIPTNSIVVSFADTGQDHLGIVYQSTNFLYTGLGSGGTQIRVKGLEHLHELAITAPFRNVEGNSNDALRAYYGDRVYTEPKSKKHRYIYITGSHKFKRQAKKALKHKILPFPKKSETIAQIENRFSDCNNIDNFSRGEKLSSKDFDDIII